MFTVIASQARLSFPFCLLFLPFLSRNKAARGLTGFLNGAATPPNLGGELSRLPIHSQHPRLRRFGMGRFSYWRSHPSGPRRGTPSPHDLRSLEEKSVAQRHQALCPGALCV